MEIGRHSLLKGYLNSACLYLDQFAVSNLVDNNPDWVNIKSLLSDGIKRDKIICPMPFEHLLESSGKNKTGAIEQHKYFLSLSQKFIFKHIAFITAQLMISQVRKNKITKNTFLDKMNPAFSFESSLEKFSEIRKEYENMIDKATMIANVIREAARGTRIPKKQETSLLESVKAITLTEFIKRLEELVKNDGIIIRGVKFEKREVTHWIDYILDVLLKINKMNSKEAKKLLAQLKVNGFDKISTLDVRSTLQAYIATQHKRQTVNDEIDIGRISTAIQISDIMVIDKVRKYELIETGLAKKYNTKVFSGTKEDINGLEKLLGLII